MTGIAIIEAGAIAEAHVKAGLEIIMGIYKSAVTGSSVSFPVATDDPFYRRETMTALMPRYYTKTKAVENFTGSGISLGRDLGS